MSAPDHDGSASLAPSLAPTIAACGLTPHAAMDAMARLGFRHVQLSAAQAGLRPRELDRSARRDLVATLRRRGLDTAGLDCWVPAEHFLAAPTVDRAVGALVAAVELAGDLGRVPVSVALPEQGAEAAWTEARRVAERLDVAIANHATPAEDGSTAWPWITDRVGLGIDAADWLAAGADPAAGVTRHADHLASVRLADRDAGGARGPLGAAAGGGRLDVTALIVALQVAAFRRPVVLDARTWRDPLHGIERSREAWRAASIAP